MIQTRRNLLKSGAAATAASLLPLAAVAEDKPTRHNRIHQSVSRWCYQKIPLDTLCTAAAQMGLKGIDLLNLDEWEVPKRYGLLCTMGYAGGGEINNALNRVENHAAIEAAFRKNIPLAAKAGVPNVITFSGLRAGMSDEEGARNTIAGLKRLKPIAEDNGVTVNMELLNSKRDHHDYMCDHTAWGVRVCEEVNSPRIKLLYDIYHMQIMEGDLIATIRQHAKWLGHFHTGGVPGRHELDDTQEVQWAAVMRAIADTGFTGYVAHEFCPHPRPAYLAPRSRSPLRCLATLGICREPTSGSVSHAKTILLLALERRRRNSSNRVVFKLTRASCTYRIAFRSCPF